MTTNSHIVLGAGPLGRATAAALLGLGLTPTIVNRSGGLAAAPVGATVVAAELTDIATVKPHCAGATAIYFCAQPPYHRWQRDFAPLLASAIALAEASGARLVVADNLYAYGRVAGPMTETLPLAPNSRKGEVRAAMHRTLLAAEKAGRIEFASARAADFFGPWVEGSAVGARLFDAIAKGGVAALAGDPDQPHSFTFVEDFGRALAILGTDPRAANQVWHVPNAPAITSRRFVELAFQLADRPVRTRLMGRLEFRAIGLVAPPVRETIEMLYQFEEPFVVDHAKFAHTFGDISTPLETALARTLAWVRGRNA